MLSLPLHLHPIADAVRRLARKGWSTAAIARAHHITSIEVRWILRRGAPVHPVDPLRRIKGPLSRHVRTLAARGETPERIGELLRLEPGHVAAFLAGPPPRSPRPPREPRPKYIPREWGPSRGPEFKDDDDLVEVPELPRAAPSEPAIAAAEAAVLRPAPVPTATPVASGDWGPYQEVPGRRPVLTDAEAAEVQELAAEGLTRAELVAMFGVSRTTIDSAIRGTLRTRPAPPEPPEPEPSPATPRPAPAEPLRWREKRRRRGPAWRDD